MCLTAHPNGNMNSPQPLPAVFWLKTPAAPERGGGTDPDSAVQEEVEDERLILCRECLFPITREEEQSEMAGAGQHTFANPAGIVFTIGCFSAAEFTWFPGFDWRVAICRGCLTHLGWHFAAPSGAAFWGLILDHLIFPP